MSFNIEKKPTKKRVSKLLLAAGISFSLALVIACGALAAGATNPEKWVKANEKIRIAQGLHGVPVAREASFAAEDIKNLSLSVGGDDVVISYGDVNEIELKYFEDYKNQVFAYFVELTDTLVIKREYAFTLSLGVDWLLSEDSDKVELVLPRGTAFEKSYISVSGGSAVFEGIALGEIEKLTVGGGSVKFNDCEMTELVDVSVSGGSFKANLVQNTDKETSLKVSGGSISIENGYFNQTLTAHESGGSLKIAGSVFSAGLKAGSSGGRVTISYSEIIGKFEGKISGGSIQANGNIVNASVDYQISGGRLYLNDLSEIGKCNFKLSGGEVSMKNIPYAVSDIYYSVTKSGGSFRINNTNKNGTDGDKNAPFEITAKISGGRVNLTTR